jgi:hypothetical protein
MGPMAALLSSLAHGGGFVRMAAAEHAALSRLYLIPARGFQGRETARGAISTRAPQFRGGDGRWLPALILPDGIMTAIGDTFVEEIGGPELGGKGTIAADRVLQETIVQTPILQLHQSS